MGIQHQELVMERREQRSARPDSATTEVKTILLQVINDDLNEERLDLALSLARAHSAHLSCLHVTPIEAYVAFDSFGGVFVMNDVIRALDESDQELREKVEARLANEDVSWDYSQASGNVGGTVLGRAALADLLITTRSPRRKDFVGPTTGYLGDLLDRARTPIFIPGTDGGSFDPTGKALIAWNGSFEAANAVRASLGLLRLASEVHILQIPEGKPGEEEFPSTRVLEYLSRQGVHAELIHEPSPSGKADHDEVAGMIVSQARGAGVSYIVMGGYSHMRLREHVFGGVTRTLLKDCPFALVIAR